MTTQIDAPERHTMEILDATGDTKVMWDKDNEAEVSVAKAAFDAAKARGASIFKVRGKNGERGQRLDQFDPQVERMIVVPQLQGG
jgi:dihydropteroate synthase